MDFDFEPEEQAPAGHKPQRPRKIRRSDDAPPAGPVPVDGAEDMLRYLSEKYLLYAASNGYSVKQRERLRKAGMISYFTDIFVSEETGSQKPQKEFFDYCFARMPEDLKRDEVVILGDGLTSDMAGGNNAGIHTCWLNAFGETNTAGVSIDMEIHSLREIRKFL